MFSLHLPSQTKLLRVVALGAILWTAVGFIPSQISAKIGVGVASSKIVLDEKLKPGGRYELPALSVINTGDETTEYRVQVSYHEKQEELRPATNWFSFDPQTFMLEPGQTRAIPVAVSLPPNADPGMYFAYLEATPLQTTQSGLTTVGIAAATRLYFEIVPSSLFQAILLQMFNFLELYSPWTYLFLVVVAIIAAILILKRFVHVEVGIKRS